MSPLEKRAWLALWGMCPAYLVYFTVLIAFPGWFTTVTARFVALAAASGVHAVVYVSGLLLFKRAERGDGLLSDERDRAIEGHATRAAYLVLMAGAIVVGIMMPFTHAGWEIVNGTVLAIVLAETVRYALVVRGYRGALRLAH
jgi:hypothetical protein